MAANPDLADMLICPITLQIMRDPVMDCNGHTFERAAIVEWFATHDTSPITNQPIANKNLTVNYAIKQLIDARNTPAVIPKPIEPAKPYIDPVIQINQNIITDFQNKQYLNIELAIPPLDTDKSSRKPITCIAVIDCSGSMGERATEYNPNGENDGFSRLDLVKHSLMTILGSLSDSAGNPDELALITFNQMSDIVLAPTQVSNKALISRGISALRAGGNTNIWAGLKNAIDMANRIDTNRRNVCILLLTDGVANYDPPRGIIPTFDTYIAAGINYTIHTFAYGYDVDSKVLSYIATRGNGIFGYIPDGTMVGTIFINAMSNILATAITNYNYMNKNKILDGATGHIYNLGNLLYGQTRNLIIPLDKPIAKPIPDSKMIHNPGDIHGLGLIVYKMVNLISKMIESGNNTDGKYQLETFLAELQSYPAECKTQFITDLMADLRDPDPNKGQLGKSVERDSWYRKWGMHYLRSVIRAYQMEQCLNFKDLAPQHFSGETFKQHQREIESVFSNIAPPEPSIATPAAGYYGGAYGITRQNQNQTQSPSYASIPASYYNVSGGCFTGDLLVNMTNSVIKYKRVCEIRPGDMVVSRDSPNGMARVVCVVKLGIRKDMEMIALDSRNGITPFHPIYLDGAGELTGEWIFPIDYTTATHGACAGDYMYDFILDSGHTVNMVGGINIACLGHGITTNDVIRHEYFGSQRVIDDLKDHPDWYLGYIVLNDWKFVRNPETQQVIRLEY